MTNLLLCLCLMVAEMSYIFRPCD